MDTPMPTVGALIRDWRQRRRLSQLALSCDAEISTRHLSFLETGRSAPSREMVLRLADQLDVPLRAQNRMLLAAGYAPAFPERGVGDPGLGAALAGVERLLRAHEPFPALAVDRGWTLVAGNRTAATLIASVSPRLLVPPINVLRLSLHPEGLAPRIENLAQWRAHLLHRLERQIDDTADETLAPLLAELRLYPVPPPSRAVISGATEDQIAVPLRLRSDRGLLSFWSATLVFGGPLDVTVSELMLETFLPADAETAERIKGLAGPA
jgi:transcriptional regulator with XRE-family HTH domain